MDLWLDQPSKASRRANGHGLNLRILRAAARKFEKIVIVQEQRIDKETIVCQRGNNSLTRGGFPVAVKLNPNLGQVIDKGSQLSEQSFLYG